ncbi:MAG: trigger factor [Candidatus Magasanikbacteria bacterium]|nr:trigger factor [Candidatus Magasanikbacteria bacterium]
MPHTAKKLDKSQIELTITVTPEGYDKHMKQASERISARVAIKGFRKGKVPYDLVKREVGEMGIMQEALEAIIQESFYHAVTAEGIETIGMPDIKIEKSAPGNDFVYTATVALLPAVTLPNLDEIKIKPDVKKVGDIEVNEVLENLTKMQAKEVVKNGEATKEDKIVIDMDLLLAGIPFEGGQAKDYQVYLSENQHIPGFNDALVGLKKDDEKEFDLPFPTEYYNKQLAGNTGTFKVKVKDVYKREFPEVTDEFAKALGQESVAKLRELLQSNLEHEAIHKADEKVEVEIFETLIEQSKFDEIPEVLIDAEKKRMFNELRHDLEKNGITIDQYLSDIKKKKEDLAKDFTERASKRAKSALISRKVAQEFDIKLSKEEIKKEMDMMRDTYKENPEYLENLKKPEVQDSIKNVLLNKKVVAFLKDKIVEGGY